ncbi:MAG TPA: T9SS type A sorting domain-containing protein, partial [Saprospiraceae bacterium]|nr:T9SS type A sorting domain-containing protein [Saprospiraceae bacterium]
DSQAFCKVEDNKNLTIFEAKIETGIVCAELPLTLDADVEHGFFTPPAVLSVTPYGVGPYQYEWYWSLNGLFNPSHYLGSTSSIYLLQPPDCPTFYVSLKVTSADGYVSFAKKRIVCDQNCPRSSNLISDVSNMGLVYPNPSSGLVNIAEIDGEAIVRAELFDLKGNLIKSIDYNSIERNAAVDFRGVSQGLYFLRLYSIRNSVIQKVIITQ